MSLMKQKKLDPQWNRHVSKDGMDADSAQLVRGKMRDSLDKLTSQSLELSHNLIGGHGRPLWPFRIVLGPVSSEVRPLLDAYPLNPFDKHLVVSGEVGEVLVRRPLA